MKRLILMTSSVILAVSAFLVAGCAREELPDNRDMDYGYVQFKLYKEASYGNVTKAAGDYDLDSLSQASKINVMLTNSAGRTISQTLTLTASDNAAAEFGLRSAKLRLLQGDYEVASYALYNNLDTQIGNRVAVARPLTVVSGGLEIFDLTADVAPRGMIRFNLVKDLSGLNPELGLRDRRDGGYTFDEIASMNITIIDIVDQTQRVTYNGIPVTFSVHFSGDEHYDGKDGVTGEQTSSSQADSIVYAPAGSYKILSYELLDSDDIPLETQDFSDSFEEQENTIEVSDNELTEADVPVTLVETDEYIRDYYALRAIWEALGGEDWYYEGQTWPAGSNWNFDKDPDLWGDQPGVQIHDNGRVASLDLSGFGIHGVLPDEIGQLTELVRLSLGDHNEVKQYHGPGSQYPVDGTQEAKARWIQDKYRDFGKDICPAEPLSPACALALRMNGKTSSAASFYNGMSLDEISRMAAAGTAPAGDSQIRPYDMNLGKLTNGLTGISGEIRNLQRLESLSIANSPITESGFPGTDVFSQLTSVTELEIYNCPELETLPEGVTALPNLITVNLSTNGFTPEGSNNALDAIAGGASEDKIQVLYFLQNQLTELPASVGDMASLGMLNVMQNNIQGELPQFGENFAPQELSFDDNHITGVPEGFCSLDALDSFSISYNDLTSFPNCFSSDPDNIIMTSINVAHNSIEKLPDASEFNGVRVVTLTLTANPILTFPKELAETDSYVEVLVMQSCGMKEFPEGCLDGEYTSNLTTLDLQYNNLTDIPEDFSAETLPYVSGMDLSCNSFSSFPLEPLNILRMTAFSIRGQRNSEGERCLSDWPEGLYTHTGLRGFYIGSNDLRVIRDDSISTLIFYLDISDNPNIVFDASDVCAAWQAGAYYLYYDPDQEIINCDAMLD